jgi:hypothetical protein
VFATGWVSRARVNPDRRACSLSLGPQPLLSRLEAPRPLPPFAIERLATVEASSLSGLFVDIHRAWVTFDDELLVWNYEEPGGGYADYGCVPPFCWRCSVWNAGGVVGDHTDRCSPSRTACTLLASLRCRASVFTA